MNGIKVGQQLIMREVSEFKDIDLIGAEINGGISMNKSTFKGKLIMNGIKVGQYLSMSEVEEFNDIDLAGAEICNRLLMDKSNFKGELDMRSIKIGENLFMQDIVCFKNVNMEGAKVDGCLSIDRSSWLSGSVLNLSYTKVGQFSAAIKLNDLNAAHVTNFSYDLLGKVSSGDSKQNTALETIQIIEYWLLNSKRPIPNDYIQLANTLSSMGLEDHAKETLFKSKYKQMKYAFTVHDSWDWISLFITLIFIGYGYYPWVAIIWFVLFLGIGWILAKNYSSKHLEENEKIGFWYSLDLLLPVIELRKKHYEIDLRGYIKYYFYLHMIMGYILTAFLLAGLSGLVK